MAATYIAQTLWRLLTSMLRGVGQLLAYLNRSNYQDMQALSLRDATVASQLSRDQILIDTLHDHAVRQYNQYLETRELGTLQTAIQVARVSANLIPPLRSHPRRTDILRTYHKLLCEHLEQTSNRMDLADALLTIDRALDFLPDDDPYATEAMALMVSIYQVRPSQSRQPEDAQPEDPHKRDRRRTQILFSVADLFLGYFEEHRLDDDLEQGCQLLRRALERAPDDTPRLFFWRGKLGHYLQNVYDQNQDVDLLTESIEICRRGLVVVPDGDGASRAALLETQANALQNRAKRNNSIEDLDAAVSLSFDAVAVPDSPKKSQHLTNLGCRLEDRFDRLNRVDDLRDAIRVSRSALPTPSRRANLLTNGIKHNIGVKLLKLYNIDKQDATFDEGFSLLCEAVETMQPPGDVPALWLNSLASAYRSRYWRNRENLDSLNTAIDHQTEAIERLPRNRPNWPGYASNMAWLLRERAERTRNKDDLQNALSFVQDAAASVPKNHVHRSHIMFSLARLYMLAHTFGFGGMFEARIDGVRWNPPWEDKSIPMYLESLDDALGDPTSRMVAAVQLMAIFRDRGEYARAIEIGEQVLDILRRTNTRLLGRDDQQRLTADFSDIAVETCALSIQAGERPDQALELLELGRGLILGLLIEDRSDVSGLAATHLELAARFERLRDAISRPVDTGVDVALRQAMVRQRDNQVRELDGLISEIRQLTGHENFLKGPTAEEVKSLAARGPIVVVNVADKRSDAILVTASSIKSVHLPELRKREVQAWLDKKPTRFKKRSEFGDKNAICREYLAWLWTACVEPILRHLHLLDKPTPIKPTRVWWIGAGLGVFLPFHAAGDHRPSSVANAYTYIISSYTPTTRALAYAQQRASFLRNLASTTTTTITTTKPSLLVALMPTTPPTNNKRNPPLRTTTTELTSITTAFAPSHTVLPLQHPSTQTILANLPHCEIAHFACHGVSDPSNPSESHLILQHQPPPSEQNPSPVAVADLLTVRHLAHHTTSIPTDGSTSRAKIAYLSACSTAESRAERLVDEVLHLASGFQVAGFPHVVATMWPAEEEASVKVAGEFYKRLAEAWPRAGGEVDDGVVAAVLREAVMDGREKWPLQPLRWAGYCNCREEDFIEDT
ncbi:CHAT domain-containing protein [Ilyonectria destructans]|nr:CHAT domain-containing protein [Ilyonectria destructans]